MSSIENDAIEQRRTDIHEFQKVLALQSHEDRVEAARAVIYGLTRDADERLVMVTCGGGPSAHFVFSKVKGDIHVYYHYSEWRGYYHGRVTGRDRNIAIEIARLVGAHI